MFAAKPLVALRSENGNLSATQKALTAHKHLSQFQVEKFKFLFNAFCELNNLIDLDNIEAVVEKVRHHAGWEKKSKLHLSLYQTVGTLFECFKDQLKAEHQAEEVSEEDAKISWENALERYRHVNCSKMNLDQWLNMWDRLCYKSAGIADFPIWVQLLPEIFFKVMDRDQDGIATVDDLANFYQHFIGIEEKKEVEKISKEGYRAMTANCDYVLTKDHYLFCFANFLLGKGIYGPGKYIFGVFDNRELNESYKVMYNAEDEEE